jgi:hypothetical protein
VGVPSPAVPHAGATSSWRTRGSCGLPGLGTVAGRGTLDRVVHALGGALVLESKAEDADGLLAAPAVAAGVALSFREWPEPHERPL